MILRIFLDLENPLEFPIESLSEYNQLITKLQNSKTFLSNTLTLNIQKTTILLNLKHIRFIQLSKENIQREILNKCILIFDKYKFILSITQPLNNLYDTLLHLINKEIKEIICIETLTDTIYINLHYLRGLIISEIKEKK